jgi:4-amino-4-deoxy-L-arabinose transferase-like glycosyltransferase
MINPTVQRLPTLSSRLSAWMAENPCRAFAAFCLLHAIIWTALPALLYPNLPLDLIEALTYGREWQLGHDKLPPLPWWMVEIVYRLVGRDVAYYLLAEIVVIVCFIFVYMAALPVVGATGALVSVLIIDGLHFFNFTAPKFNHDVIQLPFWALAGLSFLRALQSGRLSWWMLLGVALGGALWSKYFVVILALPLVLYLVFDAKARRHLLTPGPYVAAAVAFLIAAPHLIWLVRNDFLPFAYADARAVHSRGFLDHIYHPLIFLLSQLGATLPSFFIASPLFRPWTGKFHFDFTDETFRIVTLLTWGPTALLIVLSAVTGRGLLAMWSFPLCIFTGLWLVMIANAEIDRARLTLIAAGWGIVAAIYASAFIVHSALFLRSNDRFNAQLYPGQEIADRMTKEFQRQTGEPLRYVIGRIYPAGALAHYAREGRPRVLIDGDPKRAPWIDIADLKRHGAIVVWIDFDRKALPPYAMEVAKDAVVQPPLEIPWLWRGGITENGIGWAILKPQK